MSELLNGAAVCMKALKVATEDCVTCSGQRIWLTGLKYVVAMANRLACGRSIRGGGAPNVALMQCILQLEYK